jgi:hypothetical protein
MNNRKSNHHNDFLRISELIDVLKHLGGSDHSPFLHVFSCFPEVDTKMALIFNWRMWCIFLQWEWSNVFIVNRWRRSTFSCRIWKASFDLLRDQINAQAMHSALYNIKILWFLVIEWLLGEISKIKWEVTLFQFILSPHWRHI